MTMAVKNPTCSLPEGWRLVKLGEVCERRTDIRDPKHEPDAAFQYVDITSVSNVQKSIVEARNILGKDAPSRARQVIRANDVLVATTRPNLNAVAIVPPELDNQICSTGFCVLRAGTGVLPDYIFAYVRHEAFIEAMIDLVKGALYPAVNDDQVMAQLIPLPPLTEQQRIATVLREQMAAVEKARTAAQARLAAIKDLPAAFLRRVFPQPGQSLPDGWRLIKLDNVCEVRLGKMLSPASKTGNRPIPYLRNANVQWNRFDLSDIAEMDFTEEQETELTLRTGDLLVCEGGEPGRAAVWQGQIDRCCYQKALHRLRPINTVVDPYFVMYRLWLGALSSEFTESNAKTTIAHLPAIRLKNLKLAIPHVEKQRNIASLPNEQMSVVEKASAAAEEELNAINALPAALLRRAFAGEL